MKIKLTFAKVLAWILVIAMVSGLTLAAARVVTWKVFWLGALIIAVLAYFAIPKLKARED